MIVAVQSLRKRYGRFDALAGLELEIAEGSKFALIGANGAGKTTTIKILVNLLKPSGGSATIFGVDSRALSPRELADIGYVSENQELPGRLTLAHYLDFLRPFYPRWDRRLEESLLNEMQLPAKRRIRNLSHGMRVKMALVCALSFRPRLLILDEPFAGLDPIVRDELIGGLFRNTGDLTVLISSHELHEVEGFATDIGFLHSGRMSLQEPKSRLIERCREVRVTLDSAASVPDTIPAQWCQMRTSGNVLTFIDTRYDDVTLGELVRTQCRGVVHIETKLMSLRSIFMALTPAGKEGVRS